MNSKLIEVCACGLNYSYENCCRKAHKSLSSIITAEQLMRSRYVAFTKADGDYLMKSHHSSTRPLSEKKSIVKWAKSVKWLKLEILNKSLGQKNDNEGTVEFKAYYKDLRGVQFIHENSKFIREKGTWTYLGVV
jgi:SEC-C motif-containing protein